MPGQAALSNRQVPANFYFVKNRRADLGEKELETLFEGTSESSLDKYKNKH